MKRVAREHALTLESSAYLFFTDEVNELPLCTLEKLYFW